VKRSLLEALRVIAERGGQVQGNWRRSERGYGYRSLPERYGRAENVEVDCGNEVVHECTVLRRRTVFDLLKFVRCLMDYLESFLAKARLVMKIKYSHPSIKLVTSRTDVCYICRR